MADELWREEREFWLSGVAEVVRKLDASCLMVLGAAGPLDRAAVVAALQTAPRWQELPVSDRSNIEADEVVVLAYRATARRAGAETYRALCTSTWIRRHGDWRMLQHQQAPLG